MHLRVPRGTSAQVVAERFDAMIAPGLHRVNGPVLVLVPMNVT